MHFKCVFHSLSKTRETGTVLSHHRKAKQDKQGTFFFLPPHQVAQGEENKQEGEGGRIKFQKEPLKLEE